MQRIFARNIIFLIFVNLIVKPLWIFGIDRNVQLHTGNEEYGLYFALFNFSIMFQILMDMGMLQYNTNKVARNHKRIESYLPNILTAKFILTIIYLLIVTTVGYIIGYRGFALWLLFLLGILQAVNSIMLYLRSNVAALQFFAIDSVLSVIDRLFVIIACGILLLSPALLPYLTINMFVILQIIGMLITCIAAYIFTVKKQRPIWHIDFRKVIGIIKQSLPYALMVFMMAMYIRLDAIILELIKGSYEVGVYAKAYRLMDVANNLTGVLFASILLPMFGKMLKKKENVQPIISLCLNVLIAFAITVAVIVWYWGDAIMQLLYGSEIDAAHEKKILFALMIAYGFYSINYVYGTLLTANRNIKPLIFTAIVGVIVSIIGCTIVAGKYGALGIAYICALTISVVTIINIWIAHRRLQLMINFKAIGKMVLYAIIIFICGYLMSNWEENIGQQIIVFGMCCFLVLVVLGIMPFKKLSLFVLYK